MIHVNGFSMKIKCILQLAVCTLFSFTLNAQQFPNNLISNPSLDEIRDCPDDPISLSRGLELFDWWTWHKSAPGFSIVRRSAYINTCHEEMMLNGVLGTGYLSDFNIIPPRSGSGYYYLNTRIFGCGPFPDHDPTLPADEDALCRIFLKNRLQAPLEGDHSYLFFFYQRRPISKLDTSINIQYECATPDLGAYFSVDSNSIRGGPVYRADVFSVQPQILWDQYRTDTGRWTLMAGCFTADGGEQLLTLGRFSVESEANLENCQNFYIKKTTGDTIRLSRQTERIFVDDFGLYDLGAFTFEDQEHCLTDSFFFRDPYNLGFVATYDGDTLSNGWRPPGPGTYEIDVLIGQCNADKNFQLEVSPCSDCLPEISPVELCPEDSYFNPIDFVDPAFQVQDTIIALCPGGYQFPVYHPHCPTPVDFLEIKVLDYPECSDLLPLDIQCIRTALQLPEGDHFSLDVGGFPIPEVWSQPAEIRYQLFDSFCDIEVESGTMRIIQCEDCDIYVPNVFSPNGDGINDYFEISTACDVQSAQVQIFDRQGRLIRESRQLDRIWDGRQEQPGVYIYRAQIEHTVAEGTQVRNFAGSLTLVL